MSTLDMGLRVEVDTPSLRERTTDTLREAILTLHFVPGEKLVERRLCEATGVSRTCVREALRHLESEGLVSRTPNRGMFVSQVTSAEARQIYEVRAVLEAAMARSFTERASDADVAAVEAAFDRVRAVAHGDDVRAYAEALDAFSDALMDGAKNDVARQLLSMLRARITYLRMITAQAAPRAQTEGTLAVMDAIVAALRTRAPDAAEASCRAYVERSAKFALGLLARREAGQDG